MRLRVLSVAFPFAPVSARTAGGAEQILATLDKFLITSGHSSIILAAEGSHVSGLLVPTPRVPAEISPDFQPHVRGTVRDLIARTISRFRVDVVHLHGVDFLDYVPRQDVPLVVTLHLPLSWYPKELFGMSRTQTTLVCVSDAQTQSWPAGQVACEVIENGVDLNLFRPGKRKGDYLLCIGRICPEKAQHLAIEAADKRGMPLYLAGTVFGYTSHRQYFEQMIAPHLTGTHKFLGQIGGSRKRELLSGARCLLIPSLAPETSSLVAMEALACGTPVTAFRSGALAQLIEHGKTGFLVNSVNEMAQAVRKIHELDPADCRRCAEASFSADRMTHQYLTLYESLATRAGLEREALCLAS